MSAKNTCQHCGCSEIDIDPARGDAVCTNCGSVLEDNIIVSEVQFEENAHGGSRAIGQLVTADGTASRSLVGFQHGTGKESRVITLQNARRKIVQVAEQLRLNQHCIDTAFNFYKMALSRHLTRGRRNSHVVAACIYMVCRIEGTPHMLLDLSDIVQVNVYELGKTFLRLSSALCINIPAIDPCLYIVRFAHRLELGDKTHEVSMTALRLVQRMKRDWMHTGRRPSGLCGAALLVAARLHNFNRTVKDLIKIVKVCGTTIRKRLTEFGDTPSSRLTLEEFMTIDLEEEQDPPCFKAARRKQKLQQLEDHNKVEDVTSEISELQKTIERQLEERRCKIRGKYASLFEAEPEYDEAGMTQEEESAISEEFIVQETIDSIQNFIAKTENDSQDKLSNENVVSSQATLCSQQALEFELLPQTKPKEEDKTFCKGNSHMRGPGPTAATLGLKESIEECMKIKENEDQEEEGGELDLTGLDDDELDSYIMTEAEVQLKTKFWTTHHAEYLKELQEKEERKVKEMEENANKPEPKKRKRRKKAVTQANSAGEAIEKMLQEKKISSKINYDVLKNLNTSDLQPQPESHIMDNERCETPTQDHFGKSRVKPKKEKTPSQPSDKISSLISSVISVAKNTPRKKEEEDSDMEEPAPKVKVMEVSPVKVNDTQDEVHQSADDYEQDEEELEEDYDDKEESELSVAQLLGQHRGEEEDYYADDQDDYLD